MQSGSRVGTWFTFTLCSVRPHVYHKNCQMVWIAAECVTRSGGPTAGKENKRAAGVQINHCGRLTQASTTAGIITTGSGAGPNVGHVVLFDARECLKEVGRKLGVPG